MNTEGIEHLDIGVPDIEHSRQLWHGTLGISPVEVLLESVEFLEPAVRYR